MSKTNLEITKITLNKFGIKFHELTEGEYSYIQIFKNSFETSNKIFIDWHGLVELKKSDQLSDFMEFKNGELVSY